MRLARAALQHAGCMHAGGGAVQVGLKDVGADLRKGDDCINFARQAGPKENKYECNHPVPDFDGVDFKDGNIARLPAIAFAQDGISRGFPSMPVPIIPEPLEVREEISDWRGAYAWWLRQTPHSEVTKSMSSKRAF